MMKRFLMILVLGLLLNSCGGGFDAGGYKDPTRQTYTVLVKHVYRGDLLGPSYIGNSDASESIARDEAIAKCKANDPRTKKEPTGCLVMHRSGSGPWNFSEDVWKGSVMVWLNMKGLDAIPGQPKITKKPADTTPTPDDGKIIIIGSGSGFFVTSQGHVVSNDHVIGICKKVIAYEEGKEITLNILATDMVNDLGLIKGKFQKVNYLNIKPGGAELGEDIVAFGYPLSRFTSDSVKLTKGIVSALSGPGNNYSQIQIDAAIQPGSSGGPILNMNGQVVGVAVSGLSKKLLAEEAGYIPENVNFAVAAHALSTFLKANKISIGTGASRTLSTKELAKIGEPATIQLFCMNTKAEYAKLKKANQHSDVLLDLN
jgi:hypothetical protein